MFFFVVGVVLEGLWRVILNYSPPQTFLGGHAAADRRIARQYRTVQHYYNRGSRGNNVSTYPSTAVGPYAREEYGVRFRRRTNMRLLMFLLRTHINRAKLRVNGHRGVPHLGSRSGYL